MRQGTEVLLAVRDLTVTFRTGSGSRIQAVSGINFDVREGETLGLVGESGSGKSTTARAVVRLVRPDSGSIFFMGNDLMAQSERELRRLRPGFQMIFQDSIAALNPRRCVGDAIADPLSVMKAGTRKERIHRAKEMMERVGIPAEAFSRLPHELSGGQCQRIQIARALISRPRLLVCDEPVSSLDVSIQAQILNLLEEMRLTYALTLLFISHDLVVVKNVSDRVAVMYLGRLCEIGPSESIYRHPSHPYTRALLSAMEGSASRRETDMATPTLSETPPSMSPPSGCRFRTRCPRAEQLCAEHVPLMRHTSPARQAACHHPLSHR